MTKTNLTIGNLMRYSINIDSLNHNALIKFKNKIKYLSDSRQKSKTKYKIWDIVVVAFICVFLPLMS